MEGLRSILKDPAERAAVKGAPREWPLFSAPGISSMRVVNVKEKGGTLYFTVQSILEGFKWKIDKTYEDFVELQKVLTSLYGMDHPALPTYRKLFGLSLFMGVKENQAAEMRDKLETFLISVIKNFPIPPTELLNFVEYPFTDVLSVTQALAKFFYVEGDMVLTNNKAVLMSPLQLHCVNKRMTLPLGSSETGKMKDDFGHLLDFLQCLRKLKIAPPTEEHAMIADLDQLTFDLNQMKNLEVLLVESIQIQQLENRSHLPDHLLKLEVRRSLKMLQDILLVYPLNDVAHSPVSPALPSLLQSSQEVDLSKALKWSKLQQANFKLNGIKTIDQSVKQLVAVEILDLSFNYIDEVQHLMDLPHLRVLDLGHNKISNLRDLHTKLGCITKLSLASNNIVRLKGIEKMFSIQYLDLSNNQISDVSEVGCLKSLPCLSDLQLKGNPIAHSLSYRSQVFSQIPGNANQVALDGKLPSKDELVVSIGSSSSAGHKRVPSRTPDIEPDNIDTAKEEPAALEDMEAGLGLTNHLEELRKEGGDKWLSILNASKQEDEVVAVSKSPKGKKRKTKSKDRDKKKAALEHSQEQPAPVESSHSEFFSKALAEVQSESLPNLVNFSVTVLEYRNSAFLSLSEADLDQILLNTPMGESTLSVDMTIGKAKEFDMRTNTVKVTRNLASMHHLKVHERKKLAVCLRLPSSRSVRLPGSRWVLYCLQDLTSLARLYLVVKSAMAICRSMSPDNDIILNIAAEMESSLPSPLSPPGIFLRSQSDSDSIPSYSARQRLDSGSNSFTDSVPAATVTDFPGNSAVTSTDSNAFLQYPPSDSQRDGSLTSSVGSATAGNESRTPTREIPTGNIAAEVSTGHDFPDVHMKDSPLLKSSREQTPSSESVSPTKVPGELLSKDSPSQVGVDLELSVQNVAAKVKTSSNPGNNGENSVVMKKALSRQASGNSSKPGSGTNTPKGRRHSGNKEGSNGFTKTSSDSPLAVATPPLAASRKPPNKFSEDIQKKLEEIDQELPSPMYSQTENTQKGEPEASIDTQTESEGKKRAEQMEKSIYDRQDSSEKGGNVVNEAVNNTPGINKRRDRRHQTRSSSKDIVTKPGLDSSNVSKFFQKIVAEDMAEVLMNLTWGTANFSSAPLCELEVGVMITDRGMYVMEVLDPDRHLSHPLSWATENLPLGRILKVHYTDMRKVSIGIFDQSITMEAHCKGTFKKFVLFPHTQEKLNLFVENLKAAFDATGLTYSYQSSKDSFLALTNGDKEEMVLRNPGALDMASLKDDLVWSRSVAQVGHFIASNSKSDTGQLSISFESEMKRMSAALSSKFEIVQYVIAGEVTGDTLPISQGGLHIVSRALILTNSAIYLCKEELDSWPHTNNKIRPPPFPRCMVLDSHPVSRVAGIRMCDKSHAVISSSDPLYEFSISFKEMDDLNVSPLWVREWTLCVHDRQYLDQLLECLLHLANDHNKDKPLEIKHVGSKMHVPPSPKLPPTVAKDATDQRKVLSFGDKTSKLNSVNSSRGSSPCFFSSTELFEFSVLSNYQRLKFFKKYVAQAEFLKSDEVPLSLCLAHCSSSLAEYVEVEACVIVSNYAIYLLSDVDNVEAWLNSGGDFSYHKRDLLSRGDTNQIRCFYRLWLNDVKQLNIGLYYTSLAVIEVKNPDKPRFIIHTENPSATISFLNAAACVVDFHDKEEEKQMDDLLSQYDLMDDTPTEPETDTSRKKPSKKKEKERHKVEFLYKAEDTLDNLKRAMVKESPSITKTMSREVCNQAIKILYQQVVLLVEELRIRDHISSSYYPHFVFLTNFGMYVCLNLPGGKKCSPAVLNPGELAVKKWCHIDLIDRLHIHSPCSPKSRQYTCYNVVVHLRSSTHRSSLSPSKDSKVLSFLFQNSELMNSFLHHFSLMYRERCGKQIPITWD